MDLQAVNSNLCLRITTGDITEIIGALPVGKYAGYYSSGATGTPSSYGTFEAVVMNNTTATITAIDTSSGENYINIKTSNTWKGWERDITNTDLGKVITKSESKAAVSGASSRLCAITLSAGHKYIILASTKASAADASSIISCQITYVSGNYVTYIPGMLAKTTMAAGGGCTTYAYIHCNTDCVLDMACYGYSAMTYNYEGNMIAICLV